MTIQQLEAAILSDVVTRFVNLKESTSRRALLVKFRGQPAWQAIANLTSQSILRRKDTSTATEEEEYLPTAAAFQFCGSTQLRGQAKFATTIVLHTLQQMFAGERKKEGFVLADLRHHVEAIYANKSFDDETLRLGLYLAQDFGVLMGWRLSEPARTEVVWFQIGEGAISMANPDTEWDRVMTGYRRPIAVPSADVDEIEKALRAQGKVQWERIRSLGSGGQSEVFLVRSPARTSERADCLHKIRKTLDEDKRAEFAEAIYAYARTESPAELGALKLFKIPPEGGMATPGSKDYEAIERLKNEITVLSEGRPGLPKLLGSNLEERWIVTEYFPEGTLEQHLSRFRGNAAAPLKAFRSLVQTVAALHKDGYVHRDIKPPNVFMRNDGELVLGDFGIVYVPSAGERLTLTGERVGPRDYMPQWANLGARHENVEPCFDVYMLGKLLWSMVDGRIFLPREYHNRPEFDLTKTFPGDPHMFQINGILDRCVVEHRSRCLSSAQDLLPVIDEILSAMGRGGQLLSPGVSRPCRVCGIGYYQPEKAPKATAGLQLSRVANNMNEYIGGLRMEPFTCDKCGHLQFFKVGEV
jgi:serine/threonine protein kinase